MTFIAPQAKLFQHLDRLQGIMVDGRTAAPVNVEVDLSNRCSLGCEWCHFAYTHTRGPLKGKRPKPAGAVAGGDLMPLELAVSLIDQLAAAGVESVTWTGGGEPTLHPDFDLIVGYTAGRIPQGVYTHGGHIDEARAQLLKASMEFVYVSLDAADRDSYRLHKGVDRFDKACDGIRALVAADGPATVGVGFLVTRDNWQDIPAMLDLGDELGADYSQLRPTILYDISDPGVPSEDTGWLDDAIAVIESVGHDGVEADVSRFVMYRDWTGHGYRTCWWSMLQTAVTPNGKVWACVNKREQAAAEIGDLTVESFADLWARHTAASVGADCRVMCRGHLPNLVLAAATAAHPHPAFI